MDPWREAADSQSVCFKGRVIAGEGGCRMLFLTTSVPETLFVHEEGKLQLEIILQS